MKNNRIVKIITLALSCLLLVGAVIGISASAEETPTVGIKYKNIAYEGALQVLYAVDAQNVPADASVQMRFYDSKDAENYSYVKDEYIDPEESLTINGITYRAFFSKGIAPKNMRAPIYAKAVIVDAEGAVIAESEMSEYSVWQYAINRFAKSPTPDQKKLYAATLNYGASVQEMLVESGKLTVDEIMANGGWANEYCGIETVPYYQGRAMSVYYAPGAIVSLADDMVKPHGSAYAYLHNYTDEDGNEIAKGTDKIMATMPGVIRINANYMPATVVELDYEYDEDVNTKYGSGSSSLAALGFRNDKFGTSKTSTGSALIEKDESGNSYLYAQANGLKGGLSTYWQFSSATVETISYDVAFFETDLRWDGYGDDVTALQDAVYFRTYSGGTAADANRNGFVTIQDSGAASDTFKIALYRKTAVDLPKGEWFNFRLVVTAIGGNKFINEFYINGKLIESIEFTGGDAATASDFVGGTFYTRNADGTSANYSFAIDNTKFGAYTTYAPGNGGMFTDESSYGTKLGFEDGALTDWILNPSAALENMNGGTFNYYSKETSAGFGFKNLDPQVGSTHIVEFDYKFNGANSTKASNYFGWLGLSETGRAKADHFLPLSLYVNSLDGDEVTSVKLTLQGNSNGLVVLNKDTWYNIRLVYIANNETDGSGNVTKYKGTVNLYVNDALIKSFDTSGFSDSSDTDNEPNTTFETFSIEFRSLKNSGISNMDMTFDNFYLETVADE